MYFLHFPLPLPPPSSGSLQYFCQMAYHYMKSLISMSKQQKENKPHNPKAKLAINIFTPNCDHNDSQKLAFSQQLHEEYEISSSAISTRRDKKVENSNSASRMKLRDYIFLAKTSALKNANQKKKIMSAFQDRGAAYELQVKEMKKSKAELRKDKYSIKNSQMFKILKEEMDKEISDSLQEIQTLKRQLDRQVRQHTVPSEGEMVMMYNLRSLIKTSLKKSIQEMKGLIEAQSKHSQEERVEIDVDISDTDFQPEFKMTTDYCAEKYLRASKAKNAMTFGQ